MKSQKRLLSIIIAIAIVTCILPMNASETPASNDMTEIKEENTENDDMVLYSNEEDNPVISIEVVHGTNTKLVENYDGYISFSDDFIYYDDWYIFSDAVIKINYKDGASKEANLGEYVDGYMINCYSDQYSKPWKVGTDNELIVTYKDQTTTLPVTIIENPIESVELVSGISLIEYGDGYWQAVFGSDDYYFHYQSRIYDAIIKINKKDGTSIQSRVGDLKRYSYDDDQDNYHWTTQTDNYVILYYSGYKINIPVIIIESPVESLEVVKDTTKTLIEKYSGYERSIGDDSYFDYSYYDYIIGETEIKINYKDGTSKTAIVDDQIDEYDVELSDDQDENHWNVGDNYVTLSYLGQELKLKVTVIPNPVEHISINSAPTREYTYGDLRYGNWNFDGDYWFSPGDMTGLSFTVHYTDGTKKTFTDADIDKDGLINGYEYDYRILSQNIEPGNVEVEFSYLGKTAYYTVILKESNIDYIELTEAPDIADFTYYDFYPDFIGTEFTIHYKNGSVKKETITEDKASYWPNYEFGGIDCELDVDGYLLIMQQLDTGYRFSYFNQTEDVRVINRTYGKKITDVQFDNVSWNGDGMNINVSYADGTSETLTVKYCGYSILYDKEAEEYYHIRAYGKTEKGLLYYTVNTYKDHDGNVEKYEVEAFGFEKEVIFKEPPQLFIENVEGKPGQKIDVNVAIKNCPGICSFVIGLDYDKTRLTLESVTQDKDLVGIFNYKKSAVWVGDGDKTGDFSLFTITFTVKDDAPAGSAYVKAAYNEGDISNYKEQNVNPEILAGEVLVREPIYKEAYVTVGSNLNLFVTAGKDKNLTSPKMRFTLCNEMQIIDGEKSGDLWTFEFPGIVSQFMNEEISMELLDGGEVIETGHYSIAEYCDNLANSEPSALGLSDTQFEVMKNMLADMLEYGAASQLYRGYKTDCLPNKFPWVKEYKTKTVQKPASNKAIVSGSDYELDKITSATVRLDNDVKLVFYANVSSATKMVINDGSTAREYTISNADRSSGHFKVITDGIYPTSFDTVYTVSLYNGSEKLSTVTYSVNSYFASKWNDADGNLVRLVKALRSYEASAKMYVK